MSNKNKKTMIFEIFILISSVIVLICLLAAIGVFFNPHPSVPTILLFGFFSLFLYIIDKNQVKIITKGYRILFTLLIQLFDLKDESRVKLIKLAKNSEKHKKMLKQYIKRYIEIRSFRYGFNVNNYDDDTLWDTWWDMAGSLLCYDPLCDKLYEVYKKIFKELRESEKKRKEEKDKKTR